MKMRIIGFISSIIFLSGCKTSLDFDVEVSDPNINQLSTFDLSLDKENQNQLESQFDKVLNPQNLNDWMKHMSSKPHNVGSPWSKQNAEFVAEKFKWTLLIIYFNLHLFFIKTYIASKFFPKELKPYH